MDKRILRDRLEEVKKQLRANAKDVHFYDKLIDEALSLKGQISIEPVELDCGKKESELKGDTYTIVLTNKGVLYHEYGGYNIFVTPANTALYDTLADLVNSKEEYYSLTGEEKERFEVYLSAMIHCLAVPKIAFTEAEFTFDIATRCTNFIREQYEKLMNIGLQEETPVLDEQFKNATLALKELELE